MGKKIAVLSDGVVWAKGVDIACQGDPGGLEIDSIRGYTLVTVLDNQTYMGVWLPNKRLVKALRKAGVIE